MKKLLACLVVLPVMVSICGELAAQQKENSFLFLGSEKDAPVKVKANKLTVGRSAGGWEFKWSGGVEVKRGKQKMSCEQLVINYDAKQSGKPLKNSVYAGDIGDLKGIRSVIAIGNVKIKAEDFLITAGKAVFDNKKRTIEFTEKPTMTQGKRRVKAKKIIVYPYEDRLELEGPVEMLDQGSEKNSEKEKAP